MNDVNLKKLGTLRLCGGGALVALATWGVWAFCNGSLGGANGMETAFDGWYYGREDQKTASAALAAAGLDEWSWDADGRLLVPKNKRNEYQTALAEAGAYPKAPSESRRDAIREMGAFESDAKMRMRALDACAFQLERTLERTGGIEYATVGVRERREQAGLTSKTVVTASIGVACREGCELDANLLSAITVAAKHQLGVDANENVSILDLKAGKSYFGSEKSVGNGAELALATEKERVENYWRDKLEKTFDYMEGARVSVVAELVAVAPEDVVETKLSDEFADFDGSNVVGLLENDGDLGGLGGFSGLGGLRDFGGLNNFSGWTADAKKEDKRGPETLKGRATSAAERLAQVKIEEIEKPRPLATLDGAARPLARTGGAFARLGNPVATRSASSTPVLAQNLAEVGKTAGGNGILAVGATERRGGRRGVVSASYQGTPANEGNAEVLEAGKDAETKGNAETGKDAKDEQTEENKGSGASAPIERVAQIAEKEPIGKNSAATETRIRDGQETRLRGGDGKNVQNSGNREETREKQNEANGENGEIAGNGERVRFRVRALAVRIGTPRGYVCRVARHLKAENAAETFATDGEANNWSAFYQTAERKIVAETKNVALLLLRPLAERNGWSENELTRSVAVDVYAAPDDWDASNVGAKGETARGGDDNKENGPFEVVANFGQVANVEEMVAEVAEETTSDAESVETTTVDNANERETEDAETANFWASWKEKTRRLDAKTTAIVGVGVGILAFLTIAAPAARRRGKKTAKNRGDGEKRSDEEVETAPISDGAKQTIARKKRNKENKRDKWNKINARKKGNKERAGFDEFEEFEEDAQEGEVASSFAVERNGENAQYRRFARDAETSEGERDEREGDDGANDERAFDAFRNVRDFQTARTTRAGWDWRTETRNGVERDRNGVSENAEDRAERRTTSTREDGATLRGTNAGKGGGFSTGTVERGTSVGVGEFDEFDDWEDLDDDLLEIRSLIERERARVDEEPTNERSVSRREASERTTRSFGDAARRREALELIARNPEQAAESLRRWLRPGA